MSAVQLSSDHCSSLQLGVIQLNAVEVSSCTQYSSVESSSEAVFPSRAIQ